MSEFQLIDPVGTVTREGISRWGGTSKPYCDSHANNSPIVNMYFKDSRDNQSLIIELEDGTLDAWTLTGVRRKLSKRELHIVTKHKEFTEGLTE